MMHWPSLLSGLLALILTVLQGLVVYYTKNVEQRLGSMEHKLDRTWEMTLVTTTEVTVLKARLDGTHQELQSLKESSRQTREQLAALEGSLSGKHRPR